MQTRNRCKLPKQPKMNLGIAFCPGTHQVDGPRETGKGYLPGTAGKTSQSQQQGLCAQQQPSTSDRRARKGDKNYPSLCIISKVYLIS